MAFAYQISSVNGPLLVILVKSEKYMIAFQYRGKYDLKKIFGINLNQKETTGLSSLVPLIKCSMHVP